MNVFLKEYLSNNITKNQMNEFCAVVANPQSKMALDNFFRANDISNDPDNNNKKYLFKCHQGREIQVFAQQLRSIDCIKKRLISSWKISGQTAKSKSDERNDSQRSP